MDGKINVTVWSESEGALGAYPDGIHSAIADFVQKTGEFGEVRTATLNMPQHGLTEEVLNSTDVLVWWGHKYHRLVEDAVVESICRRVYDGMGLILLHSAHASKVFKQLVGTETNKLRWRDVGELERVWFINPAHEIADGLPEYFKALEAGRKNGTTGPFREFMAKQHLKTLREEVRNHEKELEKSNNFRVML